MIAPLSSEKRNRTCNIYHHSDMFACWYVDISSCFPTAVGLAVRNNRHEYLRFLFSPVYNLFQQHFADFRRPERFNTESEGGYRFEVVNLRAVFVRYADNALYVIYAQNSAFAECLYPCPNRRGDNPEQFAMEISSAFLLSAVAMPRILFRSKSMVVTCVASHR